jgi:hypothetical protein
MSSEKSPLTSAASKADGNMSSVTRDARNKAITVKVIPGLSLNKLGVRSIVEAIIIPLRSLRQSWLSLVYLTTQPA